jgi:hypothetical protein
MVGLGPNGKLVLIGVGSGTIEFAPTQLIRGGKTMEGWAGVTLGAQRGDILKMVLRRGLGLAAAVAQPSPLMYSRLHQGA